MEKTKTLKQLTKIQASLEKEIETTTKQHAEHMYSVDFESHANINKTLKYLDSGVTWDIKSAALLVRLVKQLKAEKSRLTHQLDEGAWTVQLDQIDLSALYSNLTAVTGTGIEHAKTFTTLLTNIGEQITKELTKLTEGNKSIKALHLEMAEVEGEITKMEEDTTVMEVTDKEPTHETSK